MVEYIHGGTDSGPAPLFDFSSNAHPLGPPESLRHFLSSLDISRYPDPAYQALREELARHAGVPAESIVPGAGASELIHRCVQTCSGEVLAPDPGFSEYRRAAQAQGRSLRFYASGMELLGKMPRQGVAFVCLPGNPDGQILSTALLQDAARLACDRETLLVADLAYAPLCTSPLPELPSSVLRLHAPNKSFGCTGIRAGWLSCANVDVARRLRSRAPSWILSVQGEGFLRWTCSDAARRFLDSTLPALAGFRQDLAGRLRALGWEVRESPATWILARPGSPMFSEESLRAEGIKVRDTRDMGLPGWLRLCALGPDAHVHLEETVRRMA